MSTFFSSARSACHNDGYIVVIMETDEEIRFSVADNPRLAKGSAEQLGNIEISPFGLHWPALDEDLSFRGLLAGDHGQLQDPSGVPRRNSPSW